MERRQRSRNKYLITLLLTLWAGATLYGCSQEATQPSDEPATGRPAGGKVSFATSLANTATRGPITGTAFPADSTYHIGIYMMEAGSTTACYETTDGTSTPAAGQYANVHAILTVTPKDSTQWSFLRYDGEPLNPADGLEFAEPAEAATGADFYAYHPFRERSTAPYLLDSIPFDLTGSHQPDYLFACAKGFSKADAAARTPVALHFHHAMSLLEFRLTNGETKDILLNSLSVFDPPGATDSCIAVRGTFDLGSAADGLCTVTPTSWDTLTVVLPAAATLTAGDTKEALYLMVPPYHTTDGTIKFRLDLKTGNYTLSALLPLPEDTEKGGYGFRQGSRHVYRLTVVASNISLKGLSVEAWKEDTPGDITVL